MGLGCDCLKTTQKGMLDYNNEARNHHYGSNFVSRKSGGPKQIVNCIILKEQF